MCRASGSGQEVLDDQAGRGVGTALVGKGGGRQRVGPAPITSSDVVAVTGTIPFCSTCRRLSISSTTGWSQHDTIGDRQRVRTPAGRSGSAVRRGLFLDGEPGIGKPGPYLPNAGVVVVVAVGLVPDDLAVQPPRV
jgi:hypothetical protein